MRITTLAFAAALISQPLTAQEGQPLPEGWSARADRDAPLTNVNFRPMGNGLHVTLGPAVILWRNADRAQGSYSVGATFTQTRKPAHPEAYGLFVGGQNLDGPDQAYVYFLVRGTGEFLIRRREGSGTSNVAAWARHEAIAAEDDQGRAANELEVRVTGANVSFVVNGTEVWSGQMPANNTVGQFGMRVNHNLDVHVDGFGRR